MYKDKPDKRCIKRGCRRRRMDPNRRTWRLLSLYRNICPLYGLCEVHAEERVIEPKRAKVGGFGGQRGVLYDFLRSKPAGFWVTVKQMAVAVYGTDEEADVLAIRQLVYRMRRVDPHLIEAKTGVGYRLRAQQIREAS